MITREQLKGSYSEGEALAIYNEVKKQNDFVGFCKNFMYDEDYQVARNALWGLTKATDKELSQLLPIMEEIIELATKTDNSSVRRLSLNLVERLCGYKPSVINTDFVDNHVEFLDFCLENMADIEVYPGIQSLCMKLAYRMCKVYPELLEELKRTVEAMEIDYYKPAVKSVRSRILSGKLK